MFATEITRRRDTTGIEPHDLPGGPLLWPGGPCWQNLTSPQRSILLCDQKEKTQHRLFTGHPCLDWRRLHITSLCSIRFSFPWIEQFHFDWAEETRHIYIASHRLTRKTWPDIISLQITLLDQKKTRLDITSLCISYFYQKNKTTSPLYKASYFLSWKVEQLIIEIKPCPVHLSLG